MSDYYAMSLRFYEQGGKIWLPQTYNLDTPDGITASDFPLPAWLSGLMMHITGGAAPGVYRMLSLLVGMLGLYFLWAALKRDVGAYRASALTLLFGLLPTLVFYQNSFLPSTWSLAAFLAACYAHSRKQTRWAIGLLTLAALMRKPYCLFLLGYFFLIFRSRKYWIPWLAGMLVFGAWQLYDVYLSNKYGHLFLRNIMAPDHWGEAWNLGLQIWSKWGLNWFSPWHLLVLLPIPFQALRSKREGGGWHIGLLAGGVLLAFGYFLGMEKQFVDHDYYALDCFYPAYALFLLHLGQQTRSWRYTLALETVLMLASFFWANPIQVLNQNPDPVRIGEKTYRAYQAAKPMFDRLDPERKAQVLVFEAYSFNFPLVGIQRTGYCLLSSHPDVQNRYLDKKPEYAACLDTFFVAEVVNDNPAIIQKLQFADCDGKVSVFRLADAPNNTLEALAGTNARVLTDTSSAVLSEEYLLVRNTKFDEANKILCYGTFSSNVSGEIRLVVSAFKGGKSLYYADKPIRLKAGVEMFRSVDAYLPSLDADEVRLYLWNPARITVQCKRVRMSAVRPYCRPLPLPDR
ncbi:MAG: hypothetical protein KGS48_02585 [Bacteroidetes bacterium]|nr:hypothetical protein [Bacteroidota bacterium]